MKRHIKRELAIIISETAARLLQTSEPSANELYRIVRRKHAKLIQRLAIEMADGYLHHMCVSALKRAAHLDAHAHQQFELPFEIHGIPPVITFEAKSASGKPIIRYCAINRAREEHLLSYRTILSEQIKADQRRLEAVDQLIEALRPIFDRDSSLTVQAASALYRQNAIGTTA
jgi:hypothetical protein